MGFSFSVGLAISIPHDDARPSTFILGHVASSVF